MISSPTMATIAAIGWTMAMPIMQAQIAAVLILMLSSCVTSQWDRQHQCQQTCDGKCSQSCAVVVEQGATEVKLPGH
jgi:uncharacterized membrane protein